MEHHHKLEIETRTFVRFWLVILGLGAAGFIIFKAATGLIILGAALFLALAISPLVKKLADIIPGEGRKLPIALSYIIVVGTISAFVAIVVPTVVNETQRFIANLPTFFDNAKNNFGFLDNIGEAFGISDMRGELSNIINNFSSSFIKDFGNNFGNFVGTIGNIVTATILVLVLAFFMLIEGPSIMQQFWSNFRTNRQAGKIQKITSRMGEVVSKYVSNAITIALINAGSATIAVAILSLIFGFQINLAIPLALISGVFSLIPMFGGFIGAGLVALLLAFNSIPAGIIYLIYGIVYLQIESNVISPKVQGKGLQLSGLIVLASVTVGVYTLGLIGAIISIPIAGCIKVILEELGDGFLPSSEEKHERKTFKQLLAKKPRRRKATTTAQSTTTTAHSANTTSNATSSASSKPQTKAETVENISTITVDTKFKSTD